MERTDRQTHDFFLCVCVCVSKDAEILYAAVKDVSKPLISYFLFFQVVQEYERAVIFRLGRLLAGGSRGPGKKNNKTIKGKKQQQQS